MLLAKKIARYRTDKKELFRTIRPEFFHTSPKSTSGCSASGRPTKYQKVFSDIAYRTCRNYKVTNRTLATMFGISDRTFYLWTEECPEFAEAIKSGRESYRRYHARDRHRAK
jgi:hypothetical protein